jgi:beta-phosphoglucomutase-like phosphatase (HAD superfamily)
MKLPKGLDLIIFDCDGVLVDSEVLSMRTHQSLFAELGAALSAELWAQCFGESRRERRRRAAICRSSSLTGHRSGARLIRRLR